MVDWVIWVMLYNQLTFFSGMATLSTVLAETLVFHNKSSISRYKIRMGQKLPVLVLFNSYQCYKILPVRRSRQDCTKGWQPGKIFSYLLIECNLFLQKVLVSSLHIFDPLMMKSVDFGQKCKRKGIRSVRYFGSLALANFAFATQSIKFFLFTDRTL